MNLRRKKQLATKVLRVGKNRVYFISDKLPEIKEAITKQDIKDLHEQGIILIKPVKGRKKIKRRKTKRGPGKIKKKVKKRKQTYVKITRKLRAYLKELKNQGKISRGLYYELRKKIRMRNFRSKAHLKEHLMGIEKIDLNQQIRIKKPKKIVKKKSVKKLTKTKGEEK